MKLLLHIGETKTGTSVIQSFLDINRLTLAKRNHLLYPNFKGVFLERGRFHNHWAWFHDNKDNPHKLASDVQRSMRHCRRKGIGQLLLSCESWSDDYTEPMIAVIDRIRSSSSGLEIQPILFIRRPDLWAESAWKQWGLKTGLSIDAFVSEQTANPRMDLLMKNLAAWETVAPTESIKIRIYEKSQLKEGLIPDFLNVVGINFPEFTWAEVGPQDRSNNPGFNQDVMEMLVLCRDLFKNEHDNSLFEMLNDLLGESYKKNPFESYHLFSPAQRLEILKANTEGMSHIARKYLGREDGRLFYEPWPSTDDAWQPYGGLTLEKFVPIMVSLLYSHQKKYHVKFEARFLAAVRKLLGKNGNNF
jgi:hypothetical protein